MPNENESLTDLENEKVNYLMRLKKENHSAPGRATAEFFNVTPQEISQVYSKYKRIRERQEMVLMKEQGEFGEALKDFKASALVREDMMIKLKSNIDKMDERDSKMQEAMSQLELLIEDMYADPEEEKDKWRLLEKIKKILVGRNSPLHMISLFGEERKNIMALDRILNSSYATIEKMVKAQHMLLESDPSDLPLERQKQLIRWYIKNSCEFCPGNPYRMEELERKRREKQKRDRMNEDIKNSNVVDGC